MSNREYVRITKDEFEEFLTDLVGEQNWEEAGDARLTDEGNFSMEVVYSLPIEPSHQRHDTSPFGKMETIELRVFSTVDKRTGVSRDKGSDSIKTVIWDKRENKPIAGRERTHRIKTWRDNLGPKIQDLRNGVGKHTVICEKCGEWMVEREGKYGKFLGCLGYPDCENVENIDED